MSDLHEARDPEREPQIDTVGWLFLAGDEALAAVVAHRPNLIFLDIWLQGSRLDGLQLLDNLKQEHPELPIVLISGHSNSETAVSAIKRGAYDLIKKPFKADLLMLVAKRALENSR